MKKIACVYSFSSSSWVSCQKIVSNLHKSYAELEDVQITNHHYTEPITADDIVGSKEDIIAAKPDIIVFMDHKPHPLHIISLLVKEYKTIPKKPRLVFHVFGDFTLYYHDWHALSEQIYGYEVDFIVASERQKILIDKFLAFPMKSHICPFPVDENEFHEDLKLRDKQRQAWKIDKNQKAFVYTGRLSRQKRILLVMKTFAQACEESGNSNCQLYLYGNPDFIADRFIGVWEIEGEYFRMIHRLYESMPEEIKSRIHFMGNIHNKDLKDVYQGADYLVNISVHNDEDYGMSVAEAQCCGLPAILSDWGGLAGFEMPEVQDATVYIPVRIGDNAKILNKTVLLRALTHAMTNEKKIDRKAIAKIAHAKLGVSAQVKTLANIFATKPVVFVKMSPFFQKIYLRTQFTGRVHLTKSRKINYIYREIYSSYVRPHS